ncbi:MAG: M81 family metallopeptidase [Methylocystis sp.]|nr:M81 family metallopeptidase [Methylocystis sp.]MCA3585376.1 M81 family metallopeptidase [Methylocystis sp.]MCA3588625.1 M81 family metallopeptidase [Methylocystis sp.]MCA3591827.1 M81 family metallopeptidase [Methylocystis sp.]
MPRRRRFLIAMMKHETNTFSPVVTDLQRFKSWGLYEDDAVVAAYRGTNHPTAAYIDLAEAMNAEIVSPVAAEAMPGGYVQKAAYDYLTGRILDTVRTKGPFDAILLDLHGAMVPEGMDEGGEGPLLAAIRKLAPKTPIGATFDMHGNMTREIMDNADVVLCYKHYPHIDMAAVGRTTADIIRRMILGEVKPVISWGQAGILAQTLRMGTADEPMKTAQAMTRKAEKQKGILAASVFGGFPMADIPDAGLSVVIVADGDRKKADKARVRILAYCREQKQEWIYNHENLPDAVRRAAGANDFPVILLDHADNVGSGGTSDSMMVIKEVLRQKLDGVAVATVYDPDAVKAMAAAGIGATITLDLGGKSDMPSIGRKAEPLRLTGKVKRLSDGEWIVRGPMYTGSKVTSGPTAVFETGGMQIVVTSLHHEPWDTGIFTHIGIDPQHCRYLLLKSRIHYRAGFEPIGRMTVTLDGIGVTTSDNRLLKFTKLKRPIYPLDK